MLFAALGLLHAASGTTAKCGQTESAMLMSDLQRVTGEGDGLRARAH